jgi:hypothetical protein
MRHPCCSRAYQVDSGNGLRIATAPSGTINRARRVRVAARGESAFQLGVRSRAVVGRRQERTTVGAGSGVDIVEVRMGKDALVQA